LIVSEVIIERIEKLRTWTSDAGVSNNVPIFLSFDKDNTNPPTLFKFNSHLLHDEEFSNIVKTEWRMLDPHAKETIMFQFYSNLQRVKRETMDWAKKKSTPLKRILKRWKIRYRVVW
jgi:hypothetical protein